MRKLAIGSFSFAAAVFAAVYIFPFSWLVPAAALAFLLSGALFLTRRKWLRPTVISLMAAAIGFGWFFVHDSMTLVPAHLLEGSTREICAEVLDYPQVYPEYCRVTVSAKIGDLKPVDALVYDSSLTLSERKPGDRVSFSAKISPADQRYGKAYGAYTARDLYLKLNTRSDAQLIQRAGPLARLPVRIHHALTERIGRVFPADCSAMMKALLLGDKTELYRDEPLYLALSRAGNMHALAVSGLHVAFVVGMVQLLLGKQVLGSVISILFVWAFVLITGAAPSAVRAGVMQSLLLMAPVLRRENDPPTTLGFALGLILLMNPRAAGSVSLQLSFAAMAGILCFGSRLYELFTFGLPHGLLRKGIAGPAAAAASAIAVLPFTVPLMAVHFGFLSLLSPVTAVLCSLAISLCFCGGYLACLLSLLFFPLGQAAGWLAAWIARYIFWASALVSSVPHSVLYMEHGWCVFWLIGSYLLFSLARFVPLKRGEKLLYPALLSLLSVLLLLNLTRLHYERGDGYFTALDVGQGQCLCAFSGPQTVVVDCGNQMSLEQAGDKAGRFLISRGRKQVDALILTHLDSDHVNGVTLLAEMLPVKLLIVPADASEENGYLSRIRDTAAEKGIRLIELDRDAQLDLAGLSVSLFAPLAEGESNDSGLFVELHYGDYDVLITGDASAKTEKSFLLHALPADMELLIVGHHGSRYSSCEELLNACGADRAIISAGYNTYGHPAQETLERLAACGYTVDRTDTEGNIVYFIEDGHGKKER